MDKARAQYLLERYHTQTCTLEEQAEFALLLHDARLEALREQWLDDYWAQLSESSEQTSEPASYARILSEIKQQTPSAVERTPRPSQLVVFYRWLPYVAALLMVAFALTWYLYERSQPENNLQTTTVSLTPEIAPGGNRATLILADGRTIPLSEAQSGIKMGKNIHYLDGSSVDGSIDVLTPTMLTLSTPRGGTYQITLPDGTRVWLNAATQLRYPSQFTGTERIVELDGEAYFEVSQHRQASGKPLPFIVASQDQRVEVLGTHFNVSAYKDDPSIRTTLVEGKVKIVTATASTLLHPGEQSTLQDKRLSKQVVDVAMATAWVRGDIVFDQVSLPEIFRQLERWYDVRFEYDRILPQAELYGKLSRQTNLLEILRVIESNTHLQFSMIQTNKKERRIRVY